MNALYAVLPRWEGNWYTQPELAAVCDRQSVCAKVQVHVNGMGNRRE